MRQKIAEITPKAMASKLLVIVHFEYFRAVSLSFIRFASRVFIDNITATIPKGRQQKIANIDSSRHSLGFFRR